MSDTTSPGEAAPRAGRREWIGLAVLALPTVYALRELGVWSCSP